MEGKKFMFDKNNKSKCHHGILGLITVILFGCLLLVLVFLAGLVASGTKSHCSECKYNKSMGNYMDKKCMMDKKASYKKTVTDFKLVTELTDTGFMVKDGSGKVYEVVIDEEAKIYKGGNLTDNVVQVGDKVYIDGEVEDGKFEAELIKIYDPSLKK